MIDLLILLLVPAIKCTDAGSRHPLHILAALLAYPLDLLVTHTTWPLVVAGGRPQGTERTLSDTLERLCSDPTHPDQALCIQIGLKINRATGLPHIKVLKGMA